MGFITLIKFFHGYVYVHLTGYAPERFLNLCGNHNILIWNLKPGEEGYYFCISVKGYKSLKPILKKTRTKAKILEKRGVPFQVFRYRKRKIFAAGVALFASLLYVLSCFLWNIEVNGNSHLSDDTILKFLEEKNAFYGTKLSNIDCTQLEEDLRSQFSDVIWTSIKIYGTKMTVDIEESLLPENNIEKKEEDKVYDIVATKDGIITEMVTRSGTPVVTKDAEVTKGQVLVSGRLDIYNDNGEIGEYIYQSADADITARVIYPYLDEINITYQDKIKTGETKTDYQFRFFERVILNPFFRESYELCDVITEEKQLRLGTDFYLPVYLQKVRYEAYELEEKKYSEAEIKEIAQKNLLQYLTNLEEKGIQIIGKNVMIEKANQKYVVRGTIEACESVVSYQPTEILEISTEEGQQKDESD